MTKTKLLKKIHDKESIIGIVGLGYVGLPLMLAYTQAGYTVKGFEIDSKKVDTLTTGGSYIERITPDQIQEALNSGFSATTGYAESSQCDALILCVPTPLYEHFQPDLSYILETMDALLPHLRVGQVISLESTTYPGTTEEELQPRIESTGLKVGETVFLVYSPEREDPGNPDFETRTIPKVCGGQTVACQQVGKALYEVAIDEVVIVSSTRAAEMTKLLENIYRSVNIGLVNEMKIIADKMDIDIHEVINAAATKPFGFTPFYPGPGLGGHYIPIDPFYLSWKAREYGIHTRFIELAGEINTRMPEWVISKTMDALNEAGKSLKGAQVLVLGIAYKKNVDDMRESPSVVLMQLLKEKGADISYTDPHVLVFPKIRKDYFPLESIELTAENLQQADVCIIATNHDQFDYELIKQHSALVIDTRGVYQKTDASNIIKA